MTSAALPDMHLKLGCRERLAPPACLDPRPVRTKTVEYLRATVRDLGTAAQHRCCRLVKHRCSMHVAGDCMAAMVCLCSPLTFMTPLSGLCRRDGSGACVL
mmetsp:Transcript_75699/g.202475  ORF Transcript_75699/g.202475 Transcript_75699/m.202475 type:complete len:101 (-) Transcript_75699:67-369(-)